MQNLSLHLFLDVGGVLDTLLHTLGVVEHVVEVLYLVIDRLLL